MRLSVLALLAVLQASSAFATDGATIARIAVKGTRKVEEEVVRQSVTTRVGQPLDGKRLATDVRALWATGFFEDVQIEVQYTPAGAAVVTYVVREKPSIAKILVKGNEDIDIDKINEVLDLKRDAILDVAAVKRNADKIRDLYAEKGFFLAEVDHEVKRLGDGEVEIWFVVKERAKVEVRRVTFIGNRAAAAGDLKGVMETREGSFFSFLTGSGTYQEGAFERDLMAINGWYYDHGYINVKVGRPQIALSADKRDLAITIHVEEGPQYRVGKLDFAGELMGPKKEYFDRLTIRSGEIFNRTRLTGDITRVTDRYRDAGFAYANVTPLTAIDSARLIVDVIFEIEKGQKVYVERIQVRGNQRTRDKVIRREMKIYEGDLYNQSLLDASKRRVNALGFFEKVDVTTRRGSADDRIEVDVEVEERPTGTFQIGAGFSSVENFIAQAQISQANLFGRGQTLSLMAQISGLRQFYSLRFVDPYFIDSNWTFAFDLFKTVRGFESFNREATGGDLTFGYPLHEDIRMFLTYKIEDVDVSSGGRPSPFGQAASGLPSGVKIANLFDDGLTSSFRLSLNWDARDNRLFPTRGFFHSVASEYARPEFGSDNVFDRYTGFSRFYRPIFGPVIFKTNVEAGFVRSPRPEGPPIFERFFVGGINDVRGFRPRSLGPRMDVTSPNPTAPVILFNKGGNKQLILNFEIEYPIFPQVGIKGVFFSDAGWAWDDQESMFKEIDRLRHSWGFGFRWFSPIGPLRFEWGIPMDAKEGEDPIVFEFTIGNFF
ncbi:MAG: outer membrane protein assembly factor BamA [Myxococcota bacterium]